MYPIWPKVDIGNIFNISLICSTNVNIKQSLAIGKTYFNQPLLSPGDVSMSLKEIKKQACKEKNLEKDALLIDICTANQWETKNSTRLFYKSDNYISGACKNMFSNGFKDFLWNWFKY